MRAILSNARPSALGLSLVLAVLVVLAGLVALGLRVVAELDQLSAAPLDNVQWSLSQLEVELIDLTAAAIVVDGSDPSESLLRVRRRFDIFYSRVATLNNGTLVSAAGSSDVWARPASLLKQQLDAQVPLIDGPDDALLRALPGLVIQWVDARPIVRKLALEGVLVSAGAADKQRRNVTSLLLQTAGLALLFVLALLIAFYRMITQHQALKRKSGENERIRSRLEAMIGASLDGVIVSDQQGRIIEYNAAAAQIFGIGPTEALGELVEEVIVPVQNRETSRETRRRFLAGDTTTVISGGRTEVQMLHASGCEFPAELSIGTADAESGSIFIAYVRDISARRQAENDLREARDLAMAADAAKSSFLAVMSHEMRTPLNGMIGAIELLRMGSLDSRQRHYLGIAAASSDILLRHINDVLDMTAIESGKTVLQPAPFSLCDMLQEVLALCKPLAAEAGNRIAVHCADGVPKTITADRLRMQQIVINLAGNAAKFTQNGQIRIEAQVKDDQLELAVVDTGIGIPEGEQDNIFEKFVVLNHSSQTRASFGLGLSISRRLAFEMGGTMGVNSALGQGSRFWLAFPLLHLAASSQPLAALTALPMAQLPLVNRTRRVLVIEDNEVNAFVLRRMLEQLGCEVLEALTGEAGIVLANQVQFDLILLDISMPGINGIETCRRIREGMLASSHSPIVAVTAHVQQDDQSRFAEAGMQGCLTKPIRQAQLIDLLSQFPLHNSGNQQTIGRPSNTPALSLIDAECIADLNAILPPDTVRARLKKFQEETTASIDTLRVQVAKQEFDLAAQLAHRLLGSSALFGAVRLSEILKSTEESLASSSRDTALPLIVEAENVAGPTFLALNALFPDG